MSNIYEILTFVANYAFITLVNVGFIANTKKHFGGTLTPNSNKSFIGWLLKFILYQL